MKKFYKRLIRGIVLVVAGVALAIGVFLWCMFSLRGKIRDEIMLNLADVADQSEKSIKDEVDTHFKLLESIEKQLLEMSGSMRENIITFKPFVEAYGLKRIGFCDKDGTAYGTDTPLDAEPSNLSFRDFFIRGMEGKCTITDVIIDAMDERHEALNVISKPMRREGEIIGVLGLTFYSQKFNNVLKTESFDGAGSSCAINEQGNILVSVDNGGENLGKNLLTDILTCDDRNAKAIADIAKSMDTGSEMTGNFYERGGNHVYYYCEPLTLLGGDATWYVITHVDTSYMDTRTKQMDIYMILLSVALVDIMFIGVGAFFFLTRRQREEVNRLAYVDEVTGGNNFAMFVKQMSEIRLRLGAFVALDIADFSAINVAVGVETGNAILREVYNAVNANLDSEECMAHIGKDNYVMFLKGDEQSVLAERVQKIAADIAALSDKLNVPALSARFGLYRTSSRSHADEAYNCAAQARRSIRDRRDKLYAFFRDADNQQLMHERELSDAFDSALENGEFEPWFQPKYAAATGKPVASEALVRWVRGGERISPGVFIPLFERNGEIAQLDEYMLRRICGTLRRWKTEGKKLMPVSVNLSRASLYKKNLVAKYVEIMDAYDLDHSLIEIEVTESMVEGKVDIKTILGDFRAAGIRVLMDDFGTGYSSLSLLSSGCFDTIKIDKSLADNIGDARGDVLISQIVQMAKQLNLSVTVEGVETEEQYKYLKKLEVDDIQGYYFSKPLPVEEFEKLI